MILGFDISTSCIGISIFTNSQDLVDLKHIKMDVSKEIETDERYLEKAKLFKNYLISLKEEYNPEHIFVEAPLKNTDININTVRMLATFNGICCFLIYDVFGFYPKMISVNESRQIFCPEFVVETEKTEKNPLFNKAIKKMKFDIPKFYNTNYKKFNYIKKNIDLDFDISPNIKIKSKVFSPPKEIDIKHYIWEKVSTMEKNLEWEYTRNDTLKTYNYDMSDAYVVGYSGLIKYSLKEE